MLTKEERQLFIEKVKKEGPFIIFDAEDKYKDDEILMKGLIKLNGAIISCASDRLKKNDSIIEAACLKPWSHLGSFNGVPYDFAIQFIDPQYLNNHPDVVILFLSEYMEFAQILSDELLFNNKKIARYVIENLDRCPLLWFDLPESIKYEKFVLMKVVRDMPNIVGELPLYLQGDVDILNKAASSQDLDFNTVVSLYRRLDPQVRKRPEVCETLMKCDVRIFKHLKYYNDKIVEMGVESYGKFLEFVPEQYKTREVVLKAVKKNGMALEFAKEFNDDEEIVKTAVSNCGWAIRLASSRLSNDPSIIDLAINSNPELMSYGLKRSGR